MSVTLKQAGNVRQLPLPFDTVATKRPVAFGDAFSRSHMSGRKDSAGPTYRIHLIKRGRTGFDADSMP